MAIVHVTRESILYPNLYHTHHLSACSTFAGYNQKGDVVTLIYDSDLTEQQVATILVAEANYVDNDPFQYILDNVIRPARAFGQQVMDEFIAENVLLGITQSGKTNSVRKLMVEVQGALACGSLYDAIYEARQIPVESRDPVFVSAARILQFINRLEGYLGIPLSETL